MTGQPSSTSPIPPKKHEVPAVQVAAGSHGSHVAGEERHAPLILRFWKKNLKVLTAPMIIITPDKKRICAGRSLHQLGVSHAPCYVMRRAHVSHRKQPLVKKEHDACGKAPPGSNWLGPLGQLGVRLDSTHDNDSHQEA